MLLRRALLCLVLAATAHADTISTGADAHVTRERPGNLVRMVFVQPQPAADASGQLVLLGVNGPIEVGEAYDVVDQSGFATLVRVLSVRKTDEKCPGYPYLIANARMVPGGRQPNTYNNAIAVGPVRNPDVGSKVLSREDQPPGGAPPPGWTQSLQYLVDRDGDGVPDLARYLYDCNSGPKQSWQGSPMLCIEDFARDHTGWRSLGRVQFGCR